MDQVWFCGSCRSLNELRNKSCYRCRARREATEMMPEGGAAAGLASGSLPRDPSLLGGLLVGLLASVVAVGAWYAYESGVARYQGRLAWLIGVIIGIAVVLGGRGRSSIVSVVSSAVLTIGAVAVGEYLIASRALADQTGLITDAIAIAPPAAVVAEITAIIGDDPLRPILWLLAVGAAIAIPWRRLVGD